MTLARPLRSPYRFALAGVAALVFAVSFAAHADAAPHRIPGPTGKPSDASVAEARARFSAGNRAVDAGRWADALADFERAYSLSGVPAALFNAATTLRALGRHVEARDAFDQLLDSHPDLEATEGERARTMRAEEQGRIAVLQLAGLPTSSDLAVSIDGRRVPDDRTRPLAIELDAGHHDVRVEGAPYKPFRWGGDFRDGEKRTVRVELAALPPSGPAEKPAASGGVLSSPIFWTIVGVVVVGASAGAIYWGVKGRDQRLDPASPNVVHL